MHPSMGEYNSGYAIQADENALPLIINAKIDESERVLTFALDHVLVAFDGFPGKCLDLNISGAAIVKAPNGQRQLILTIKPPAPPPQPKYQIGQKGMVQAAHGVWVVDDFVLGDDGNYTYFVHRVDDPIRKIIAYENHFTPTEVSDAAPSA